MNSNSYNWYIIVNQEGKVMSINRVFKRTKSIYLVIILLLISAIPAFAASLNLTYEQAVTDSWGNEIGYRTVRLTSPEQLPVGNPWRDYLNEVLPNGRTIYTYLKETSQYLSKPLNLTVSDRDDVCYSSKRDSGFNVNLFKYVTEFPTSDSKRFIVLHEFGHIAMLNAYPSSYNFSGLNYGADNRHYMDEILPNYNTAWVEGWANGFAALKNNGMIFNLDMKMDYPLAFLQNKTFDEISRNELFVAKMVYDTCKQIPGGQNKVFNTISKSGPHYSIKQFCNAFTKIYPNDKIALAKLLIKNSKGKINLSDLLAYTNNGSRTVSRDYYNYLSTVGLVKPVSNSSNTGQSSSNVASNQPTPKPARRTSIWGRIFDWFARLFGSKSQSPVSPIQSVSTSMALAPQPSTNNADAPAPNMSTEVLHTPSMPTAPSMGNHATSPILSGNGSANIAQLQEEYYKTFAEYNKLLASNSGDRAKIHEILNKLSSIKARLKTSTKHLRSKF